MLLPGQEAKSLSPAQIQALQRLVASPEWKLFVDLSSIVLDEITRDYLQEGIGNDSLQEGVASAKAKGEVQGILKLLNRLNLETNKDVRGNTRE